MFASKIKKGVGGFHALKKNEKDKPSLNFVSIIPQIVPLSIVLYKILSKRSRNYLYLSARESLNIFRKQCKRVRHVIVLGPPVHVVSHKHI